MTQCKDKNSKRTSFWVQFLVTSEKQFVKEMSSIAMSPCQLAPRVALIMMTKFLYAPISMVTFFQALPCGDHNKKYSWFVTKTGNILVNLNLSINQFTFILTDRETKAAFHLSELAGWTVLPEMERVSSENLQNWPCPMSRASLRELLQTMVQSNFHSFWHWKYARQRNSYARIREEWTFTSHLHRQEVVLSVQTNLINGTCPKSGGPRFKSSILTLKRICSRLFPS